MDNNNENNIPQKRQSSRKKRKNSSTDGKENTPKNKKIKTKKRCSTDGIAISKQLAMKKQRTVVRNPRTNNVTRICSNGKPMPSLADLEKLFEDSDTEEQPPKPDLITPNTPRKQTKTADENKLLSPNTVSKIAEHMMEIITNTDPKELLAQIPVNLAPDTPPPPVIPPKKRKKTDVPYIVGCKERPQVPYNPCTNFCKGDGDYGVDNNTNNIVDDIPNKRRKKSKLGGFSKSIFNAQSDDIAERLKTLGEGDNSYDTSAAENDAYKPFVPLKSTENNSDDSCDSNKTVDYCYRNLTAKVGERIIAIDGDNLSHKTTNGKPVSFSPLPSTSRDNETFIKNDKLFNESLTANSTINEASPTHNNNLLFKNDDLSNESLPINSTIHEVTEDNNDNDVQIVEVPCETIIVNDEINDHSSVEMTSFYKCSEINGPKDGKSPGNLNDDDCIILTDDNNVKTKENTNNLTTIIIDDEYSNINIEYRYKDDVDEIIDIDSLIEENEAIIKKIDKTKKFDSVIEVVEIPNSPSPGIQQAEPVHMSVISENTSNYSEPSNIYQSSNTNISNSGSTSVEQTYDYTGPIDMSLDDSNRETNLNTEMDSSYSIGNIVADFFRRSQVLNATNNVFTRIDNLISTLDCLLPNNSGDRNNQPTQMPDNNNYTNLSGYEEPSTHLHTTNTIESHSGNARPYRGSTNKPKTKKTSETQKTSVQNVSPVSNSVEKGTRNIGDCPICMDSLSNNAIASTICGHVFCLACIQAAIKSGGKRCPTCRKVLKGAGYHQLYL